jgi:hypothetical protein
MVPKEIRFINLPAMDFFLTITRLPSQDVHRIPRIVRLMMIFSKSNNAITRAKMQMQMKLAKQKG